MTTTFRAASQIELTITQVQIARLHLKSSVYTDLLEGFQAAAAAFTRSNLITANTQFADKYEAEQWEKLKLDAHKLIGYYTTRLTLPKEQAESSKEETTETSPPKLVVTVKRTRRRLSENERAKIMELYLKSTPIAQIAKQLGRDPSTIATMLDRLTKPVGGS